ncbi:MAG: hypothetical protein AAGH65_09505 [Pseudomonadota bacterium]
MNKILQLAIGIPALLFLVIGLSWFFAPSFASEVFDMGLLEGRALATQLGDLGSLFLTASVCMLMAVVTHRRIWFYPAMMLMGFATIGRLSAWLLHDAALTLDMIAVEVVLIILMVVAAQRMTGDSTNARQT